MLEAGFGIGVFGNIRQYTFYHTQDLLFFARGYAAHKSRSSNQVLAWRLPCFLWTQKHKTNYCKGLIQLPIYAIAMEDDGRGHNMILAIMPGLIKGL